MNLYQNLSNFSVMTPAHRQAAFIGRLLLANAGEINHAFHGTSIDSALNIEREGFNVSHGKRLFLGDGVYFYFAQPAEAIYWGSSDHVAWAVIRARIVFGRLLNLTDSDVAGAVARFRSFLIGQSQKTVTDAQVINALWQLEKFDAVIAVTVPDPTPIWVGSELMMKTRLNVCVRNLGGIFDVVLHMHGSHAD